MSKDLVVNAVPVSPTDVLPDQVDPQAPKVGRWYWYTHTYENYNDETVTERSMRCVVSIGSNYVELEGVHDRSCRVHDTDFWSVCEYIPNPEEIIAENVEFEKTRVQQLMKRVKEVTTQLAVANTPALHAHAEVQALALHGKGRDTNEYKAALILAQEKTLPELFKEIKNANESMSVWMRASLIPMMAEAEGLKPLLGKIQDRIYNVELYAGLVEIMELVRDGEPAQPLEKVHVFQNMAYMDEECLAHYEVGGMDFKNIGEFDTWLSKGENFYRLFPKPRCVVAFRVRRSEKAYRISSFINFAAEIYEIENKHQANKLTFLYLRNGDKLFRLSTTYEFESKLFPDMENHDFTGKMWINTHNPSKPISDARYQEMQEELKVKRAEYEAAPEEEKWHMSPDHLEYEVNKYEPFDPGSVYYDDTVKHLKDRAEKHNRLVLILQGILDRSPAFHPHPPWVLWNAKGFQDALELIYDSSRALVPAHKPDFEAYRAKLNATLKEGSITIGQQRVWLQMEAKKENTRRRNDYRLRSDYLEMEFYEPYGNSGPGKLAEVESSTKKTCTYSWNREKRSRTGEEGEIRCQVTVDKSDILNVSAYTPGDFKQFFADPRTRQDYLQWAPMLLEAEEYHANNREVKTPVGKKVRVPNPEASREYHLRKARKALIGKAVRLIDDETMKSGTVYKKGSLWRIYANKGREFALVGICEDGTQEQNPEDGSYFGTRRITNLQSYDFEVDNSIPEEPKKVQPKEDSE